MYLRAREEAQSKSQFILWHRLQNLIVGFESNGVILAWWGDVISKLKSTKCLMLKRELTGFQTQSPAYPPIVQ